MPIKNLTDSVVPSFGIIGKLRKGDEKSENKPGKELDYWRFTSDRPEIVTAFTNAFGEKPRNIKVFVPFATPDEAFPTWCEVWGATGLSHRCDGETAFIWLEDGKYKRGSKPCPGGHKDNDPLNDAVGRLSIIIPELVQAGYVGYVTMVTHGKHDILAISKSLQAVYESRLGNPLGLRGVSFDLRRVQEEVSTPGFGSQKGNRSKTKKWNVKLEPSADWVRLQLEMAHNETMQKQLPDAIEAEAEPEPEIDAIGELNAIGTSLWHDQWEKVKKSIGDSYGGDVEKMLEWVKTRRKSLSDNKKLSEHIAKSWKGMERLIPLVRKLLPKATPENIILGVSQAAATKAIRPELSDQELADVAFAAMEEENDSV